MLAHGYVMALALCAMISAVFAEDLSGVTINLLTEKDTIIHNPAHWKELFYNQTGVRVNLFGVAQGQLHQEIMAAAKDRVNYYDLFIYQGQRIAEYVDCDVCDPGHQTVLEDITDWVAAQPDIVWPDIAYYIRSYVGQYNGRIYAIPMDGDVHYMYYNTDLLGQYATGAQPPRTWDEFNQVAATVHDGLLQNNVTDKWAVCLPKMANHVWPWYTFTFLSPYIQSKGTQQGVFFDPNTFGPLLDNDAVREALRQMKRTNDYGPPFQFDLSVADSRAMFADGKCALTIDWGDIILLANKSQITHGRVNITRTPGSAKVWERTSLQFSDCTTDLCPYAIDGINYASFAATGGWVGAVNTYSTGKRKEAALQFLALIGSQRVSQVDVTRGFGLEMCRTSEMQAAFWEQNGFTPDQAESAVTAVSESLTGPNTVNDLRIKNNVDYEFVVLDPEIRKFLLGNQTADDAIANIIAGWAALTAQIGLRTQLAVYRRTLALPPLSKYDCTRRGCDAVGGNCVADDTCICNDGWTGADCSQAVLAQALQARSPVAGVVIAIVAFGVLSTTGLMVFLVQYAQERVVKTKSPVLLLFVCIGLIIGYCSVLCSIGVPTTLLCSLEPVLLTICSSLVLGVLVAKTYRIKRIFNNPHLVIIAMRNRQVLNIAAALALPNLILIVLLVALRPPMPVIRSYQLSKFWTCQSDLPAQEALKSLLIAYNFFILGVGVVFGFQTRHVLSEFNESKSIGDAVYVITFGTAIVFPLSFVSLDLVVITSIRLLITVISLFVVEILLIGKIVFQYFFVKSEAPQYSIKPGLSRDTQQRRAASVVSSTAGKLVGFS